MQTDISQTFGDAADVLTFIPGKLDTHRTLWFARDIADMDAIGENAVCLGSGADFDDFPKCREFFSAFPSVFIAVSDSEIASALAEAIKESGARTSILLPRDGAFGSCDRVHDVLERKGIGAVSQLMMGAKEISPAGLLEISSIHRVNPLSIPSVLSGVHELDKLIGGFAASELTIWTGKRGSGKSTVLGQTLLDAIDQHQSVCVYSGELAAWRFKSWLSLQAAGSENIRSMDDPYTGKTFYTVPDDVLSKIDLWWKDKLYLYDNKVANAGNEDSIISVFEYAVRRYGCSVFLVDNLMTARYNDERDFYRAQSAFVGRLVEFAKKYEVHVHLVAHPRKTSEKGICDADDVGGSGDVTNRADNVIAVHRLNDDDACKYGFNTILEVMKNRAYGENGKVGLLFDPASRRLYKDGEIKQYGWVNY